MSRTELVTIFGGELDEVRNRRLVGMKTVGGARLDYNDLGKMLLAVSVAELLRAGLR